MRSIPDGSMRVDQFVSDAHDLVQLLLQRFHAPECYLVAHSWGWMFGALTAARYPALFYAYVGIGQVAGLPETQQVRYQFALDAARKENNQEVIADLTRIGPPPHESFERCRIGKVSEPLCQCALPRSRAFADGVVGFESPAYSWIDLVKIPLGARYSFAMLWREIFYKINLFRQAPRLEVPVYFFLGRYDEVVTTKVAEQYFNALDAPRGKQLICFEKSGHWPHFNERQKYRDELINRVLKETGPASAR